LVRVRESRLPNTPVIAIVDDITFGKDGERSKPRVLEVQWRNIMGNGIDQFRDANTEVILEPAEYRTGTVIAPYNGGAGE
jgi:branched-chain amino acid transport system substrate-binding protein